MADGRAFGLAPYVPAGDLNAYLMTALDVKDNATYREAIIFQGQTLSDLFLEDSASNIEPISRACPGGPVPKK